MSDYYLLGGRQVPRTVAEQALALVDQQVGVDRAIAADQSLARPQPPITLEEIGNPTADELLDAEHRAPALRHAQELVAKYVSPGRSLVEELMSERRAEAASE